MQQISLEWTPPRRPHYTVSQLTAELRDVLAAEFSNVRVAGEISGVKNPPSGHFYFTLKDQNAQLRCVCYRMTARYLKFKPQDGVEVLARGRVDIYDQRGDMQFIVDALEPLGHGALQLAFEQLKAKLAEEGLFDAARKKPLPPLPQRIGIVTSPSGAVIRDILHVLERRCPGRHVRLYPAQVQGEAAPAQLAEGIGYFAASDWAEVIIVARGGGSLEDLWAFNDEGVARVIAASPIPVISAVGHETDFTIADFVADVRAPTPSAAAELVAATRQSLIENIATQRHKLLQSMRLTIALQERRLRAVQVDGARLRSTLGRQMQRVDELDYRLRDVIRDRISGRTRKLESARARLGHLDVRLRVSQAHRRLETAQSALRQHARLLLDDLRRRTRDADASLRQSVRFKVAEARTELAPLSAQLTQLSPLKILDRGYAIVQTGDRIVKSPEDAPPGSALRIRVASGEFAARSEAPADGAPADTEE